MFQPSICTMCEWISWFCQSSDAGEYKCVASNDAGTSEGVAMLTVQGEHLIKPNSKKNSSKWSFELKFICLSNSCTVIDCFKKLNKSVQNKMFFLLIVCLYVWVICPFVRSYGIFMLFQSLPALGLSQLTGGWFRGALWSWTVWQKGSLLQTFPGWGAGGT